MITKERLEELIKQGATVWSSGWNEEVDLSSVCNAFYDNFGRYIIQVYEDEEHKPYYYANYLEEDVETAKFKLKYQNITRTETLNLPTWEEVKIKIKNREGFIPIIYNNRIGIGVETSETSSILNVYSNKRFFTCWDKVFEKSLTKENYYTACELCRKLFLGEVE